MAEEPTGSKTDLESQVLRFTEDEAQLSLVFPSSLTAQERSFVKKLAQASGLVAQSYGLGDERQIHLFKEKAV